MNSSKILFFSFIIIIISAFYAYLLEEQTITGKAVSNQRCNVNDVKDSLRMVLFSYFESPANTQMGLDKIKDLLNFYLNINTNEATVNCGGNGIRSGVSYKDIVTEAKTSTAGSHLPKCNDNTAYGECSATKPLYCYSGTLIQRCESCGCPWSLNCSSGICVNLTQATTQNATSNQTISDYVKCYDNDNGKNVYIGGNVTVYKNSSFGLVAADSKTDKCFSNVSIEEGYCNGLYIGREVMDCPTTYECKASWNNTGDYCGIKNQTSSDYLKCVDSDGDNIYTGGNVTSYLYGSGTWYKENVIMDTCSNTTTIKEAYCSGTTWLTRTASCPANYECKASWNRSGDYCGIKNQTNQTFADNFKCIDSDGGRNIYVQGMTTTYYYNSSNNTWVVENRIANPGFDSCINNFTVYEISCIDGARRLFESIACPSGYICILNNTYIKASHCTPGTINQSRNGTLKIVSNVPGGWVYKDNNYQGQTPVTIEYTGSHTFGIYKQGYNVIRAVFEPADPRYGYLTGGISNYTTQFTISAGDTKIFNITLQPVTSSTCEDSDAAYIYNPSPNDYMVAGKVTLKDAAGAIQSVYLDTCIGNFNINEYRCQGNTSKIISAVCPVNYHCQNSTQGGYCKLTTSANEVPGTSNCRRWEQLDAYDIKFMHMMHMGLGRDQTEFAKYKDSPDWRVTRINSNTWHFELPNSQQISPSCAAKKFIKIDSTRVKIDYYNHCGYTVDPTATHDYTRFCDGIFPKT